MVMNVWITLFSSFCITAHGINQTAVQSPLVWKQIPGKAIHIDARADHLWAVSWHHQPMHWNGNSWTIRSGAVKLVTVTQGNRPYILTPEGKYHYLDGAFWQPAIYTTMDSNIYASVDMSADGIGVMVSANDSVAGCVFKYLSGWEKLADDDCNAVHASMGKSYSEIWKVTADGKVASYNGNAWNIQRAHDTTGREIIAAYIDVENANRILLTSTKMIAYLSFDSGNSWVDISSSARQYFEFCEQATIGTMKVYCLTLEGEIWSAEI